MRTLDAEVIVADGSADTATLAELVEEQPAALTTVTETLAEEPLPAVHVIARVPAPAVIVPPVRFQEYAAPAPASSVLAALDGTIHKLEQQLRKHKDKRRGHRARGAKSVEAAGSDESEESEEEE